MNRQFFFLLLLLMLYFPQTATSYHHSTSIHIVSNKLNAILLLLFLSFLFFISYPHENDYGEQNDDDVRCGKMESMWRCKGNKLKLPLGFILLFSFSSSENGIKRKICLWMFLFFFCGNLWCAVCDLNTWTELSNYLTRKSSTELLAN